MHRIVIVGGGAGGLELATRLGRKLGGRQAEIVLVDGSPTHIWKPLLHEVATGALNTGEDEVNYFGHAWHNGYRFEFGWMDGLDREARRIHIAAVHDRTGRELAAARTLHYDTLVLAVGAIANDFGTSGAREHCMFLNNPADAEALRRRILDESFAVAASGDAVRKLSIGIVGGGPTGVELAAEIDHTIREMHHLGANLSPAQLEITVIEGAPRILASAPESLSRYAEARLAERGILVACNSQVAEVDAQGFMLRDGRRIISAIRVWAAGVKAPQWLTTLGLHTNRLNQIEVTTALQTLTDPDIFALGDCASAPNGDGGTPLPATAQVAHQQAEWLAGMLTDRLKGRAPSEFVFKPQGMMVSLGKHTAVGSLAAIVGPQRDYYVQGRGAKLIYASLYRLHQAAVHGWVLAALLFIGDKLRGVARPTLKLH
ncbi:NAD(P)/FAD-dependent oxidoreductase [Chitinilyticum piscinae]|uniref:NAD(P)/FAD-dependent oxidoreductase n=1 Tax=Chitinilyticum piscinae TaxID=2866724 RepID=A0A8J7FN31_9NEIS|nr:NAD(P)/FAD-dependent oxidoreductase [Chitinilyticum piscinae]MBE9610515.1 NAD(P)/FAD-dependent oxidoreductase [Chitinilyticum piscinae]